MECKTRHWRIKGAENFTKILNNKKILDNLRDGIPFPYTIQDAREYIPTMLNADKNMIYAFAITIEDDVIGSIGLFRQVNIHSQTVEMGLVVRLYLLV